MNPPPQPCLPIAATVCLRGLAMVALCVVAATCGPGAPCDLGCGRGALLRVIPSLPDSPADSASFGSTVPRVDTIQIINDGGGELRWAAQARHASPWLTLTPDTGTAGQSAPLRVHADPTGLALGVYRDTVVVASLSGGGALQVPVVFRIHP